MYIYNLERVVALTAEIRELGEALEAAKFLPNTYLEIQHLHSDSPGHRFELRDAEAIGTIKAALAEGLSNRVAILRAEREQLL